MSGVIIEFKNIPVHMVAMKRLFHLINSTYHSGIHNASRFASLIKEFIVSAVLKVIAHLENE